MSQEILGSDEAQAPGDDLRAHRFLSKEPGRQRLVDAAESRLITLPEVQRL